MKLISIIQSWTSVALLTVIGAVLVAPVGAQARDQVPFRAEWNADIQTIVNFPIATVIGSGQGQALHLGRVAAESIAEEVNLATGAGEASYRFTVANGDEVLVHFVFTAIPTSPTLFEVNGVWQITGGTGRFVNASGAGTYEGTVEFTGPDTALGHFVMKGTVSSPGSLK